MNTGPLHVVGKVSGVYYILNTDNGRTYVGSSQNIRTRIRDHFSKLEKSTHVNLFLQRDYNKCGVEKFEWGVLEVCEKNLLIVKEQAWLDVLGSYNICKIAGRTTGIKRSEESKAKQRGRKLNLTEEEIARRRAYGAMIRSRMSDEQKTAVAIRVGDSVRGKALSEEHREKIRQSMRTPETQARLSSRAVNIPRPMTDDEKLLLSQKIKQVLKSRSAEEKALWRSRLAESAKNRPKRTGYKLSEETKKKISEKAKGRRLSAEHKARISEGLLMRSNRNRL